MPVQIQPHLLLNEDGQQFPLIYFEEFWLLRDKLIPLNSSVDEVPLHLSVKPMKLWWMQIQQQVCVCVNVLCVCVRRGLSLG